MGQSTSSETPRQSKFAPQSAPKSPSKITVQWEWQSSETQQWTPYEPAYNYLLEKAHRNQQEKTDLGDAIVIVNGTEMVEQTKKDTSRQRQVRRNEEYIRVDEESKVNREEENARKTRLFGVETPKTYTRTLVCLEHFLVFFENRGPEIQNFVRVFKEIEDTQDMDRLNKEIVPLLVDSLRAEATQSKKDQSEKEILDFIQKLFTNFEQFYTGVLKAYSINAFLSTNLNQYLRNEDWIGLDCLLPYASCLCKAFIWYNSNNKDIQVGNQQNTLTLYRGAQLDEAELRFYNSQAVPTFSWNGVTSVSTDRKAIEKVMYTEIDSNKTPVMFVIEAPISPKELKNSKWINIKTFSANHNVNEIILGPGSIFKLTRYRRDHKGVEMSLRLVAEVDPHVIEEQILLGAIQAEMARNKIAKIEDLERKELEESLTYLKGNKLFEGLELRSCKFNAKTLSKLQITLSTLPNLKGLVCASLSSKEDKHLDAILQALNKERILNLEINDSLSEYKDLNVLWKRIKDFPSLSSLTLNFPSSQHVKDESLVNFYSKGLRYMTSLKALNLNFTKCTFLSDLSLANLSSYGLKHLPSLTTLTLSFAYRSSLTDTGLTNLCEGLRHLTSLTTLNLDFEWCTQITDEGLMKLYSEGLKYLSSLATLTLHLEMCDHLSLEGLTNFLSKGVRQMASLVAVNLNCQLLIKDTFTDRLKELISEIEAKGVSLSLNWERLRKPEPLTTWHFRREVKDDDRNSKEDEILSTTDTVSLNSMDELEEFYSKDIESRQHLKSLTVKRSSFGDNLNEEKLMAFYTQGIQQMTSLTTLNLDFREGHHIKITDEYLTNFCLEGLRHLTSLRTLSLCFIFCGSLTDKSLTFLCFEGLRHLTSLANLTLDVRHSRWITDKGLTNLGEGLRNSTSLAALKLGFTFCDSISGKGLTNLCSEGLRHVPLFATLSLSVEYCDSITDKDLTILCSEGLRNLPSLTTLSLNCGNISNITDEGLTTFCCEGIGYLNSIKVLNFGITRCDRVTPKGLRDLELLIKYFGFHT